MSLVSLIDETTIVLLLKPVVSSYRYGPTLSPEEQARFLATVFSQNQFLMIAVGFTLFFCVAVTYFVVRAIAFKKAYRDLGVASCSKSEIFKDVQSTRFRKFAVGSQFNMTRFFIGTHKNGSLRIFDQNAHEIKDKVQA